MNKHDDWIRCMSLHSNGHFFASGSDDLKIIISRIMNGKNIRALRGHAKDIQSIAINKEGKLIVSGSWD